MNLREAKKYVKRYAEIVLERHENPYSSVTLSVPLWNVVGSGNAICSPEDEWDVYVGAGKAYGRAVTSAAEQIVQLEANLKRRERLDKEDAELAKVYVKFKAAQKKLCAAQVEYGKAIVEALG